MNYFTLLTGQEDKDSWCPSLSLNQRIIGFFVCTLLGWWTQMMSFASIFGVVTGSPTKFAIVFTLGNIITILSTSFLIGFVNQFKNMMTDHRREASIIFLSSIAFTLVAALMLHSKLLVFVCVLIEFCAYVWYCASYIPYGRNCIKNCLGSIGRN
ncbi:hypothetical protein IMG5_110770 [Ichthyophthirius multifiliis]|uniref:Vesicle transport protein n=1 Tax=Ichthyophthirius multifiliis TaxID=5932 RepID=G0QTR0_ICHMU|nr:hypothetical protein IMG5_110770 [Ichthyophthirius multifiliis]EGR31397.1 hypothetical protein IMG5_110770 [Ichthyophthirius multifiliis]|eukprot:XP_004034883.1 hypothetical protein IMG5_110770 [Ichthyophthirius multifiliis]